MAGGNPKNGRKSNDFYPTPQGTTRALLPVIDGIFPKQVWEPACGMGHMSRILTEGGYDVTSTDLIDRGFGSCVDFLRTSRPLAPAIVTNPPFNLAVDFIVHALSLLGVEHMALILPNNFWNVKRNVEVFELLPPRAVLPMTWRLDTSGEGRPTLSFMWCIWSPVDIHMPASAARVWPLTTNERRPGTLVSAELEEV